MFKRPLRKVKFLFYHQEIGLFKTRISVPADLLAATGKEEKEKVQEIKEI